MVAIRREPLIVADTYRGMPVDPIAASVIRDMERERVLEKAGLTEADVWQHTKRAFDPAIVSVEGAPGAISPECDRRLAAIARAGSVPAAIALAQWMPEVAAMANANADGFPLFQRVKELRSPEMAGATVSSGLARHYANHVRLMAYAGSRGPKLRLEVVRHFAGNTDYGSRFVHDREVAFDKAYSSSRLALFSAGPSTVQEFFPGLTPAGLADYLRTTIATGKPPIQR